MSDKQLINGYNTFKKTWYSDNVLSKNYFKVVLNSEGKEIANIGYDENNVIRLGGFKTFFFGGKNIIHNGNVEGVFEANSEVVFYFKDNGLIEEIDTNTELFNDSYNNLADFMTEMANGPILSLMTPDMLTYFTNLLPLVPNF